MAPGLAAGAVQAVEGVLAQLHSLSGIRDFAVGSPTAIDWRGPEQGWSVAFTIAFDDTAAVRRYLSHPAHSALISAAAAIDANISTFYIDLIEPSSALERSTS